MTLVSRVLRSMGSLVFAGAGAFYVLAPPMTTTSYFDTSWPAVTWGWVFFIGGILSLIGVFTRYIHLERFGVLCVTIAGLMLTTAQASVMFDDPVTWTRGGGTLAYLGLAVWALERWHRLGVDERAINAVADER